MLKNTILHMLHINNLTENSTMLKQDKPWRIFLTELHEKHKCIQKFFLPPMPYKVSCL